MKKLPPVITMNAKNLLACVMTSMFAPAAIRAAEVGDPAAPIEISDWLKGDAFSQDDEVNQYLFR